MEITSIVSHRNGRIIFTGDSSGCWKIHALIPFSAAISPEAVAVAISRASAVAVPAMVTSSLLENPPTDEASPSLSEAAAMAAGTLGGPFGVVPLYSDMVTAMWKIAGEVGQTDHDKQAGQQLVSVRMVDHNGLKESVR
jgi:hypothetical protein